MPDTGPAPSSEPRLWGQQYPFERNELQRTMTLTALVGVLTVALVILVHADFPGVLGVAFICAGLVCALTALSRQRYVRETRLGFDVLGRRGGGFILGSAAGFAVVGVFVAAVVIHA